MQFGQRAVQAVPVDPLMTFVVMLNDELRLPPLGDCKTLDDVEVMLAKLPTEVLVQRLTILHNGTSGKRLGHTYNVRWGQLVFHVRRLRGGWLQFILAYTGGEDKEAGSIGKHYEVSNGRTDFGLLVFFVSYI